MYVIATVVEMFDKIKVQDIYCEVLYIYRQRIVNRLETKKIPSLLFTIRFICYKFSDILCLNMLTKKRKQLYCVLHNCPEQKSEPKLTSV